MFGLHCEPMNHQQLMLFPCRCLPADSANGAARTASIKEKRAQIGYNYKLLPKLALASAPPAKFVELSDAYMSERIAETVKFIPNKQMTLVCCPHCCAVFPQAVPSAPVSQHGVTAC